MRIRFLADANLNQKIVTGLLLRESTIDFQLPEGVIAHELPDPDVLALATASRRILVTHDLLSDAIEELLLIWHLTDAEEWTNTMKWLPL